MKIDYAKMKIDYAKEYALVSEMNTAFGNPKGIGNSNRVRLEKQITNVMHELKELTNHVTFYQKGEFDIQWLHDNVRDDLTDMKVFAYGMLHLMGEPFYIMRPLVLIPFETPVTTVDGLQYRVTYLVDKIKKMILEETNYEIVLVVERLIMYITEFQKFIGLDATRDMENVVSGLFTRFIKDDADLAATKAIFEAKGVTQFYTEGDYPKMVLKSAVDQPDAPQGKFLKSASYKDTVFAPCEITDTFKTVFAIGE